jgi:hypothetical protein
MRSKLGLSILLCFFSVCSSNKLFSQTQNFLWAQTASSGSSEGQGICVDPYGNTYVTGYGNGTLTFGSSSASTYSQSAFLAKYDALGNALWVRCPDQVSAFAPDDVSWSVACDAAGNAYIAGKFTSDKLIFGSDTLFHSPGTPDQFFIAKYDPYGNAVWARTAENDNNDVAYAVCVDAGGNILVGGYFQSTELVFGTDTIVNNSTTGYPDAFLVKYDPSGNVIWAKNAGGTLTETVRSITTDTFGNIYLAGYFSSSSFSFGSSMVTNSGSGNDIMILKFDTSGNPLWGRSGGGTGDDQARSICVNNDNSVSVCGYYYSSTMTLGSAVLTNASVGYSDLFVARYAASGMLEWAVSAGGAEREEGRGIAADAFGNNFLTGYYRSAPFVLGANSLPNSGLADMFITKMDSAGNYLWAKRGNGTSWDYGETVCLDSNENIYITGHSQSPSISFGSITLTHPVDRVHTLKMNEITDEVWPGDANADHVANNIDLLPLGIYYGQTGPSRTVPGNIWQADSCMDWGTVQPDFADIKNVDCNGDGVIDDNDTLAINLNFGFAHAFIPQVNDAKLPNPSLSFTSSDTSYAPGSWVDIDIIAGTSALPVNNLYGIAFGISYDASLVQPGSASLVYPASWFAAPGTDAIKLGVIDAVASVAYAAETRTDKINRDGYGKIATFRFQAKASISSSTPMSFSFPWCVANDSAGGSRIFVLNSYSVVIAPSMAVVSESSTGLRLEVYPNPGKGLINILFVSKEASCKELRVTDLLGQVVYSESLKDKNDSFLKQLDLSRFGNGMYAISVVTETNVIIKKVAVY